MICNCEHNNTHQSELRIVRGNDFATLYTINAKYSDDTPVPNWDITRCTDISVKVHRASYSNGIGNIKDISTYGSYRFANTNVLIIDWDGLLMKVGTYTVDFAAKFDGVDIRWYSKLTKAFDIVESNEEANIPEDAFIDDGIYRLDGDFVLMFGVQQQADWDEEDPTHPAYIKNRPEGIDTRDLLRKDEAALIYLAKADAHIPEHGSLDTSTKEMNFYDENDVLLFSIDATAALKDASISDITYSNGYLTFQFNADAERPNIQFYIGDAFDSDSYYNKIASDLRYVTATTLLDYYTAQEVDAKISTVNSSISSINEKIPAAATSSNKLADRDFVNSSISTATATFRGTSATGLTESQFITWANSLTHDLNDYVYWNTTDTAGNTVYKRYKYNGTAWVYEYDLNNSSFTSSEWAAIQSGITTSLVTKLSDLPTNASLTNSLSNKQDTIGDLTEIRQGAQAGSTALQASADEEDITISDSKLKFKDRGTTNGMGYVILRSGASLASQMTQTNTIYEIRYNFTMTSNLSVPSGCVLRFNGGSIGGAYTLTFNNTILENAEGAFTKDVIPSGTIYGNSVNVDWWRTSKISASDYTSRVSVTSSDNDTIFNNIFSWSGIKEIIFGAGIYGFSQSFLPQQYTANKIHIKGKGYANTCLYFPQSEGFLFNRGDFGNSIVEDFTVHSNKECFKFYVYSSSARYNACHENYFKNLILISDDGDFAFGSVWNYNAFIYANRFDKIRFWVKEGSACFCHLSGGLGHSYIDIVDTTKDFVGNSLSTAKSTIWDSCGGVYAKFCNTGYGIKHIYTYKNAGELATSLGLDESLGRDQHLNGKLVFEDCNFESYLGEFILYGTSYVQMSIRFIDCKFTTKGFANFTNQVHISASRLILLDGFPTQVYDDTAGSSNDSVCIINNLGAVEIKDSSASLSNGGNSSSVTNEDTTYLQAFYESSHYNYAYGGKEFSIADEIVNKYKSIYVTTYDLSNPPSSIVGKLKGVPELIKFTNATSSANEVTLSLGKKASRTWGKLSDIAPIIMTNDSQYIITVKMSNVGCQITLIPHAIVYVIGSSVIYPKFYTELNGYASLGVNVGDVINSLTCVEKNSGVYFSTSRTGSYAYKFSYDNAFSPQLNGFALDGYAYICVKAGTTASTAPTYSTVINTITTDGTAEFLCIGKNALLIRTSGTTAQRPTLGASNVGVEYYDTDMTQTIVWDGTYWTAPSYYGTVVAIDTTTSIIKDADIITL